MKITITGLQSAGVSRRKAPVECYVPIDGVEWDVLEASENLGLDVIVPKELFDFEEDEDLPPEVGPHVVAGRQARQISQGDKIEECRAFMKMRFDLLMKGLPVEEAEKRACSGRWKFYTVDEVRACFKRWPSLFRPKTGSGAAFVDNSLGQKVYTGFMGLISKKRRRMQRSFGLFAHRAWCVEFFTSMGFNAAEATTAFMGWPECQPLRRMSVDAIGIEEVKRDIERCVLKFGDGRGAQPADPKLVTSVLQAAERAVTFRARELLKVVEVRSLRHLQTILKLLMERGELRKIGGSKNSQWQHIRAAHKGIDRSPPSLQAVTQPVESAPTHVSGPIPVLAPKDPIFQEFDEEAWEEKRSFYRLGTQPPANLSQPAPYRPIATGDQLAQMSQLERRAYATRNWLVNPYGSGSACRQRSCVAYEKDLRKIRKYSEHEMAAMITLLRFTGRRQMSKGFPGISNLRRYD